MDEQRIETQKELRDLRYTVCFLAQEIAAIHRHGLHHDDLTRANYAEYIVNKTREYLNHD
jgi:hypothetical protein